MPKKNTQLRAYMVEYTDLDWNAVLVFAFTGRAAKELGMSYEALDANRNDWINVRVLRQKHLDYMIDICRSNPYVYKGGEHIHFKDRANV